MDSPSLDKPDPFASVRVVLCQPSHPGNIGAAARAMKTMGLSRLVLVNPRFFPHPDAEARASGATDVLAAARVCASLDEALAGATWVGGFTARHRELAAARHGLRDGVVELARAAAAGQEVALVFGTEMTGMTREEAERCHLLITVPANPAYSSLNLGSAVQLAAYEMRMALTEGTPPAGPVPDLAPAEELEGFYAHLEEALLAIDFLDPRHPKKLLPRLRRLFTKARLERDEVSILRGIFTQILKQRGRGQ